MPAAWPITKQAPDTRAQLLALFALAVPWLEAHRAGLNVEIQDQTDETAMIALQGPKSVGIVAGLFDADVAALAAIQARPFARNSHHSAHSCHTHPAPPASTTPRQYE